MEEGPRHHPRRPRLHHLGRSPHPRPAQQLRPRRRARAGPDTCPHAYSGGQEGRDLAGGLRQEGHLEPLPPRPARTPSHRRGQDRQDAAQGSLHLSKTTTKQLVARYNSPAPHVLDTSLRPEKHIKTGAKCPCSYPSKHSALSVAAVTYLSNLNPHRAPEYEWMAAEIAYSRLYMAGHLPSDILAGALIGDLVGDYLLATGGHTARRSDSEGYASVWPAWLVRGATVIRVPPDGAARRREQSNRRERRRREHVRRYGERTATRP
ncbi:phosphatase PAP2 family protein [Streptomyces mirabilis]|uniref:phosphatase PAP2 family protein n=1 Tax=Streptomyces mirabilis TaxID=68239 RepID=UPI00352FD7AB